MMTPEATLPPAGLHLNMASSEEDQSERFSWPETKTSKNGASESILTGN